MTEPGISRTEPAGAGAPSGDRVPEGRVRLPRSLVAAGGVAWRVVAIAAAGWLVLWLLIKLRVVVLPAIVALLITTILQPLASWLRARGWPRLLAAWAVLLAALVVVGGVFGLLAPQVASELGEVGQRARQGFEDVVEWLAEGPLDLSRSEIDRYLDQALDQVGQNTSAITSGVVAGAVALGEAVAGALLTLVLVFFFVKDGDGMFEWLTDRLGARVRPHAREVGERAWRALGGYVRGTAVVAVVDAVVIGIGLLLIGVPLVMPLAVLTFFGGFFPLVGAVAAGALAALVALVTNGVVDALLVVALTTAVQQIEGDVLQPIVLARSVRLHPVVILLSLTAGAVLAGIAGAFLAVPVAAVATVVGGYFRERDEGASAPIPA
ncbi:MAG TPA: AI-2E family transporter [Actinomycetota bacterium]|nr:AI-2E family transporter [Actinomycetota bacterium]